MNIKDILNLSADNLASMTEAELKSIANALASASNKRIKRLQAKNLASSSMSINARKTKSGKIRYFSTKLKKSLYRKKRKKALKRKYSKREAEAIRRRTMALEKARKNKLKEMIGKMRNFLQSPSSTIEGAKENKAEITKDLGKSWDDLSDYQKNKFWRVYEAIRAEKQDLFQREIAEYLKFREILLDIMLIGKHRLRNEDDSFALMQEYLEEGYKTWKPKPKSPLNGSNLPPTWKA